MRAVSANASRRQLRRVERRFGRPDERRLKRIAAHGFFGVARARQRLGGDDRLKGRFVDRTQFDEPPAQIVGLRDDGRGLGMDRRELRRGQRDPGHHRAQRRRQGSDQGRSAAAARRGIGRCQRVEVGFELHVAHLARDGAQTHPSAETDAGVVGSKTVAPFKDCFKDQR